MPVMEAQAVDSGREAGHRGPYGVGDRSRLQGMMRRTPTEVAKDPGHLPGGGKLATEGEGEREGGTWATGRRGREGGGIIGPWRRRGRRGADGGRPLAA